MNTIEIHLKPSQFNDSVHEPEIESQFRLMHKAYLPYLKTT